MDTFKLEPQPDEGDTNNSETLDHAVLDQQVLTQHNKFGFTNSTKKSAKKNDAPVFRALVLIGVAAAFHAAVTPHMTTSSVEASKLAETNHPVAVPPQWLPVLLANHAPNAPPAPPCTNNGTGGTTGRGAWPPHPVDPSSVLCVDVAAQWEGFRACHNSARCENSDVPCTASFGDDDDIYNECHTLYKNNTCYPPGDSDYGCILDAGD
jgi:hypothetical protein